MRQNNPIFYQKIQLPFKVKKPILAVGPQTKNTLCFVKGNFAYLSAVHTDLNNPTNFLKFEKATKYFLKKKPQVVAYDLHPEYISTKYALSLPTTYYPLPTQHHQRCGPKQVNNFVYINLNFLSIPFRTMH